tara:strand:+ start:587 stop:1180 length:594 start_codon:yes stop_codon:yes gene_type:complete
MKLNQLIRAILNLLGIYTIFTAIVSAGLSVILIPVTAIYQGKMEATGFSTIMVLFQFFLPLTLGILLVWKSKRITEFVLVASGIDVDCETEQLEIKEFPFVAFSLLGLYMLSQTIPGLCQFIAYLFQLKVYESSYITTADGKFLENHLQDIIYHAVAVGFSLLVFMKGKSFGQFALSLRKRGQPVGAGQPDNPPVKL